MTLIAHCRICKQKRCVRVFRQNLVGLADVLIPPQRLQVRDVEATLDMFRVRQGIGIFESVEAAANGIGRPALAARIELPDLIGSDLDCLGL